MDATVKRRTRKITFDGQKMSLYQPTEGQLAMMGMVTAGGGASGKDLKRLFDIMSALCVDPEQWDSIEGGIVAGTLDVPDLMRFAKQMFEYEWPPEPKQSKAARTARKASAVEPPLPDDDDEEDEDEDEDEG